MLKQTVTYKAAKKVWDLLSYTLTADHNRDENWGSLKILRGLNQIIVFTFSKKKLALGCTKNPQFPEAKNTLLQWKSRVVRVKRVLAFVH